MSNRFVSGGTINPTESSPDAQEAAPREQLAKNAEWEAVQAELENDRRIREAERLKAATGEERSLYDVLQANKAAKQAAFEEANKIRNQFRALDDDEVEFLDEVVAAKRKEEERVRRETEDGVKAFRERQRRTSGEGVVEENKEEDWGVGKKRKRRDKDKEKGVVKKKVDDKTHSVESEKSPEKEEPAVKAPEKKSALVDYGSDSDE